MSSRLLITALVSIAISALAWAQAESTNPTPPPAAAVAGSAPTESSVSRDKDTLSVDFPVSSDAAQPRLAGSVASEKLVLGDAFATQLAADGKKILYASTHLGGDACPPPADRSKGYVWAVYPTYDIYLATDDAGEGSDNFLLVSASVPGAPWFAGIASIWLKSQS